MINLYTTNTLRFNQELCNNCKMCSTVCPHAVFEWNNGIVSPVRPQNCMECGACQLNCPTGAITVESGVGCAVAMIYAALTGEKRSHLRMCVIGDDTTAEAEKNHSTFCGQVRQIVML